jgi:hypothetical protein
MKLEIDNVIHNIPTIRIQYFLASFFSFFVLTACVEDEARRSRATRCNSLNADGSPAPSLGLSLIHPVATGNNTTGINATPEVQVSEVKSGQIVKLYADASCTNLLVSGEASSTSKNLIVPTLTPGTYNFYAQADSCGCSTSYVSYTYETCPSNFVFVGKNSNLSVTKDFCISKYEMKCTGTSCSESSQVSPSENAVAISSEIGKPWVRISQSDAQLACDNLGSNYDLISNPEWMTVAYEVEANGQNWSSGVSGAGSLYRGHSDGVSSLGSPSGALEASSDEDPYYLTGNSVTEIMGSGKEQRRTLRLANNQIIWDFSGNVWEWTNWDLDENLISGPTTCSSGSQEFPSVNCSGLLDMDYLPGNPANINAADYDSTFGLGTLIGGTGGGTVRGGISSGGTDAGIFSLDFEFSASLSSPIIGFRCVYRP